VTEPDQDFVVPELLNVTVADVFEPPSRKVTILVFAPEPVSALWTTYIAVKVEA